MAQCSAVRPLLSTQSTRSGRARLEEREREREREIIKAKQK